ncbi:PREDICTED: immunoglobulin superfamily member 23 [Myotis brandtii]|uniref:immunoglobulin superfamily member 23 n=1 Tax=Myotis brandtii TaxID=109478 RepID=UPI0003BB7FEF|nr:PREDICTED: immunoglobulin superfamily member 23 [Myotis brandtii]
MRRPLNAGSAHGPAWNGLLLTGTLLASCICPASSELPSSAPPDVLTEGASAHLPVPRNLDGILSTSWFRGHRAQQEAMVSSPEGRPEPGHTDAGSDTAVLDTSRGRRSVTEQAHVRAQVLLHTFPETLRGVVQSELNYSVILSCLAASRPTPVIYWTFNGQPRGTGEKLVIRRLSREDLGTYMCVAKNSQEQLSSEPVKVSLPEVDMDSTDEPVDLDPILTVSGGSAIALLLAGCAGLVVVMVGIGSAIAQAQRTDRRRIRRCC